MTDLPEALADARQRASQIDTDVATLLNGLAVKMRLLSYSPELCARIWSAVAAEAGKRRDAARGAA